MTDQRFIIEMGMGNDLWNMDYQAAARRAIEDAYAHVTLPMLATLGLDLSALRVQVTVGVQAPEALDTDALSTLISKGQVSVRAVFGGQNVVNPDTGDTIVIASAAVEAFLPYQGNCWTGGTT